MCQASNILYYSPQKDFAQGSTGIKNGKLRITWGCFNAAQDQHRCNGRVLPQNTSWYQDMIYQIRRDTKKAPHTWQLMRGLLSWGSSLPQMEMRERRILPACLERPLTPQGLSGDVLDEQVGVDGLVISYQKQGRTDQTLLIWLTRWCGIYSSSLQGRSSWRRSAIKSVSISRSSLIMSGSLGWKFWMFVMTSRVWCNTGNIRIGCDCEDLP